MDGIGRIYIQCNPLLDISAHVGETIFKKYNIAPASACIATNEQLPIYKELEEMDDVVYVPGGAGLNTARIAQWMGQGTKGDYVFYTGCIADDKYGRILKEKAEREGVKMNVEYTTEAPTGKCGVLIRGKERSLIATLAAANFLSAAHLASPIVEDALKTSKIFYLTGFTLTTDVNHVLKIAKEAHSIGGIFMMNLSAPFIIQIFSSQLDHVMPYIDLLFSNDDEAQVYNEVNKLGCESITDVSKKIACLPYCGKQPEGRIVVVTRGSDSTIYSLSNGNHGEVPVKPVPHEEIIDTNAAGDSFVGGFLAAFSRGCILTKCIDAGNYAASVVIRQDGCTYPDQHQYEW